MASPVFLYRVFLASPGGLESERNAIIKIIEDYNKQECLDRGIIFHPVIWEDAPPTMERPQSHLNKRLRECDFFLLILWDRWGSPPSRSQSRYSSGTEEEYREAISCCLDHNYPMRDVAVMFKEVNAQQVNDPGPQLSAVLRFKQELTHGKEVFFSCFDSLFKLENTIRMRLAQWSRDIIGDADAPRADPGTNTMQYTGERISLNFQDIEIRAVLQLLADFTGLNVISSDTVRGNITLRLKDVPWDEALHVILRSKGLSMRQEGDVIWVASPAEIAASR